MIVKSNGSFPTNKKKVVSDFHTVCTFLCLKNNNIAEMLPQQFTLVSG